MDAIGSLSAGDLTPAVSFSTSGATRNSNTQLGVGGSIVDAGEGGEPPRLPRSESTRAQPSTSVIVEPAPLAGVACAAQRWDSELSVAGAAIPASIALSSTEGSKSPLVAQAETAAPLPDANLAAAKNPVEIVLKGTVQALRDYNANGGDLHWQNENGQNLLFFVSRRRGQHLEGTEAICNFLLGSGVPFDIPDRKLAQTPLFFAAAGGVAGIASLLLARRANARLADRNAQTPLFYAARHGHVDCLQLLLQAKADAGERDVNHQSPLFYTTQYGHSECTRLLLQTPTAAPAGALDCRGRTALFGASDLESCRLLLSHACDVNVQDLNRQAALFRAARAGSAEKVGLLLEWRAEANMRDRNRQTPLFYAAAGGHRSACQVLVEEGSADPKCQDALRHTAAKVAENEGFGDLAALLNSWSRPVPTVQLGRRRNAASFAAAGPAEPAVDGAVARNLRRRLGPPGLSAQLLPAEAAAGVAAGAAGEHAPEVTASASSLAAPAAASEQRGGGRQVPAAVQAEEGEGGEDQRRTKYVIVFADPTDPSGRRTIPFGTPAYLEALRQLCETCPLLSLNMWSSSAPLTQGPSE